MKIKLLFFLALYFGLLMQSSIAQTYTPFPDSNAVWSVLKVTSTQYSTCFYGLLGDTIINAMKYNKLYFNDGSNDSIIQIVSPNTSYFCAIRQDTLEKKVYFIPKDSINELLLYDFGINTGDSFIVYNELGYWTNAYCTSTGYMLVNNEIRNVFSIKTDIISTQIHTWVEGVGNIRGLFETSYQFSQNKTVKCLTVNDSLYYKFDGNIAWGILIDTSIYNLCYHHGVIVNLIENDSLNNDGLICPNPLTSSTIVSIPEYLKQNNIIIYIFDLHGRKIKEFHSINNYQLVLYRENFNSGGFYFVSIKSDNYLKTMKLFVQ